MSIENYLVEKQNKENLVISFFGRFVDSKFVKTCDELYQGETSSTKQAASPSLIPSISSPFIIFSGGRGGGAITGGGGLMGAGDGGLWDDGGAELGPTPLAPLTFNMVPSSETCVFKAGAGLLWGISSSSSSDSSCKEIWK